MQGITSINASNVKEIAAKIKKITDDINLLIGQENGKINADMGKVDEAWKGAAADSYKAEVKNAQAKFNAFYATVVKFSNAINSAAELVEMVEAKTTVA